MKRSGVREQLHHKNNFVIPNEAEWNEESIFN